MVSSSAANPAPGFLLRIEDKMESIGLGGNFFTATVERGGGVGILLLLNLRKRARQLNVLKINLLARFR
ncbi:hypothetical protein ACLK19_17795 [Escherichia coli]